MEDAGKAVVTGEVNVKEDGAAETVYNVALTDKPIVTKDVTVGNVTKNAGDSLFAELPTAGMTASAGSVYGGTAEGPASNVLDGNVSTIWHTDYANSADNASNGGREKHWITIDLGGERLVSELIYTPRTGVQNGTITEYQIEVSADGTNFIPVAKGNWAKNANVKTAEFGGAVLAKKVRLRAIETNDEWATAAEIRLIGTADTAKASDKTALLQALAGKEAYADNTELPEFSAAVKNAKDVAADNHASAADVQEAANKLANAVADATVTAKAKITEIIKEAETKEEAHYNLSSWNAYQEAVQAAKNLKDSASDEEVLEVYSSIASARANLILKGTAASEKKKALKDALKQAEQFEKDAYTEESWKAFEEAVDAAKALCARTSAVVSEKEIADISDALKEAQDHLEKKQAPTETPDTKETEMPDTKETETPDTKPAEKPEETLKQGGVYKVSALNYKITNLKKKTVALVGSEDKKTRKSVTVKNTVKINGVSFKVTAIGANALKNHKKLTKVVIGNNVTGIGKQAFAGCSKLKSIQIKAKALKSVGSKAFKGIDKKAVIKVPKNKKKAYAKKFAGKGQAKTVKIK